MVEKRLFVNGVNNIIMTVTEEHEICENVEKDGKGVSYPTIGRIAGLDEKIIGNRKNTGNGVV